MEKFLSISKAAKTVGMTSETLRHYDRIDLVKPSKIDEWTGYRLYSQKEIVLLNTVKSLQYMDLSLAEIKEILNYSDLNRIVSLLKKAEQSAEQKIIELKNAKEKIVRARNFYESKIKGSRLSGEIFIKEFPKRVILLSDGLCEPTVDNLWNYHRHYYSQIGESERKNFVFEDMAGIYESDDTLRLFAVCNKYKEINGIKIMPKGEYLCVDCLEENRAQIKNKLLNVAKSQYNVVPQFVAHFIVLSGILQWNYQLQIPIKLTD